MQTLSQIGLAMRLHRSAAWVRKQGDTVSGIALQRTETSIKGTRETWVRIGSKVGLHGGYRLVETPGREHEGAKS